MSFARIAQTAGMIFPVLACALLAPHCPAQPPSSLVYTNSVGGYENRFVIGPSDAVSGARYRLEKDGPVQFDRLRYVRDIEFQDGRQNAPQVVRGWMYEGSDKSENTWRIIFGQDQNTIPGSYPVYYTFQQNGQFTRWLLDGGTRRQQATFDDEVHAILWANQVDVDRLGLSPFQANEQTPLSVSLAWNSIDPELNQYLNTRGGSVGSSMVRLPDGRFQMDLQTSGNVQQSLYGALRFRNDLDVEARREKRAEAILASDISREFFTNNEIDLNKVATGIAALVESESPDLRPLNLRTQTQFSPSSCYVSTAPWQLIICGGKYCQFWKIRFGFEEIPDANQKMYRLSMVYEIGECEARERNLGEQRIIHKYTSFDAEGFHNFTASIPRDGEAQVIKTVSTSVATRMPEGHSLYDPMESFTLKEVFDRNFRTYVARMQGQ